MSDRLRLVLAMNQHPATPSAAHLGYALGPELAADVVVPTEVYKVGPQAFLRTRRNWQIVQAVGADKTRGGKSNPVMFRKSHTQLGRLSLQISEPVQPAKYGPERWLHAAMFTHDVGAVAAIGAHLDATAWRSPGTPIRREYDESLASLVRTSLALQEEGFSVVGAGDLNWPNDKGGPAEAFRRAGLHWWRDDFGWIWWDPRRLTVTNRQPISKARVGGDHGWMLADFKAVR